MNDSRSAFIRPSD